MIKPILFAVWASVVFAACVDDPNFNIGYGGCSTYAPGAPNNPYCATDGATTRCVCACGGGSSGSTGGSGGQQQTGGPVGQYGACVVTTPMCASGMYCQATASSMYGTCQPNPVCGVYETLSNCGTTCDPKCGSMTFCSMNCNPPQPACICASGYARYGNQCIPQSQCSQSQQSNPVQTAPAPTISNSNNNNQYQPNVNGVVGTQSCSTHSMCGTQNYCYSCTKCFLSVGYVNSKAMCGSCYANPLSPQPSNCGPISSCATRQDSIDGTCPNYGANPSCGANQQYMSCASYCEPTCGQPDATNCNQACAPPTCQCIGGYRRLGNQCVLPYQCPSPAPTCAPNEVYLTCSSLCEQTCGQPQGTACPSVCGPAKCQCANGYVRMGSQCVLPYQCQGSSPTPGQVVGGSNCGQNEVYMSCSSLCEPQCGQSNVFCTTACGPAKCQCASGYVRSGSQCVSPSTCPQQGTQNPPTATLCGTDTCTLQCSQGRVMGSNGCPLCQCVTSQQQQTDPCNPSPCTITQTCVPLSFTCNTFPCQKYTCVGKTGGKPPGASCISSTECQSFNICYKGPFSTTGLCQPGSG